MSDDDTPAKTGKVRVTIDLRRGQMDEYEKMASECGLTPQELFNVAMTLYQWAVKESRKGRRIGSVIPNDLESLELIEMPALARVRPGGSD
ncbi:hypothetical protein [Sulfitobacter sp. R18_1]|uniref:hypothetical protein n=1 Tax=Sulfitobacter sp. R18_1 TaxID=2821104 RepID=UPI001AD9A091|nr:hypothetical protein [Sulfitobacter sp. R18_1]MBO9428684.1 hypothetical protein [Sulfitobacter sp. R18_1]